MFDILALFADQTQTPPARNFFGPESILPLALGAMFLWIILVVMPRQRRADRERQELLKKMTKGDKVLTIAGIYGTVVSVHETEDEVTIKVDDSARLKMTKGSIAKNITAEENLKKAKEAGKTPAASQPAAAGATQAQKK